MHTFNHKDITFIQTKYVLTLVAEMFKLSRSI